MQAVIAVQWSIIGVLLNLTIGSLAVAAPRLAVSPYFPGTSGQVLGWGFALGGVLWFRYGIDDSVNYVAHDRRIEFTGLLVGLTMVIDPLIVPVWSRFVDISTRLWHLHTPVILLPALALSYGICYRLDRRLLLRPAE